MCDQRETKQEERSLKMCHQLVVPGSFHVQQAYFILNSGVCHKASASKRYIFGTGVTELSPLLTTTSCCFLLCWQRKARDAKDASELICAHRRIWSWADWVPTYCHSSINLSPGVFSFSVELSDQRNLCQRQNGLTRRFARKSWPLANMTETV